MNQTILLEGPVEGTCFELACSECGRVYHRMSVGAIQNSLGVQFDVPALPCHVGMLTLTAPPLDPLERVAILFGIKPKSKRFRATLHLLDGMIYGYTVEEYA